MAVAVVFGLLFAVRLIQGGPPADSVTGPSDPRESTPALVDPGDHLRLALPGDTLWSIARELAPASDPRPVVDLLVEANGGSAIEAGQMLVIPAEVAGTGSP